MHPALKSADTSPMPIEQLPMEAIEVRRALSRLRSPRAWERRSALEQLAVRGAPWRMLLPSMADRDPGVRITVVGALADAGADDVPEIIDHLLGAIDDRDPGVCAAAIHALKVLRVEQARAEIIAVLDDWVAAARARPTEFHAFCVAKAAVGYLAALGPSETGEHITPLLGLRWSTIRSLGAWAIGRLGYAPSVPALLNALDQLVVHQCRSTGEAEEARIYIRALAALGAREAVPLLVRTAQEAIGLRSTAVTALTRLDPDQAAPRLVHMLKDPGQRLFGELLRLIVTAGYRPALPTLRAMLRDRHHARRSAALRALADLRDTDAAEEIRDLCLNDPNPFVRSEALAVLARLLGEGAAATLAALADDTNALVRQVAAAQLERRGRINPNGAAPSSCTDEETSSRFLHAEGPDLAPPSP